jgi:hypothetical protein
MLSVIMLNVVKLSVVAPSNQGDQKIRKKIAKFFKK